MSPDARWRLWRNHEAIRPPLLLLPLWNQFPANGSEHRGRPNIFAIHVAVGHHRPIPVEHYETWNSGASEFLQRRTLDGAELDRWPRHLGRLHGRTLILLGTIAADVDDLYSLVFVFVVELDQFWGKLPATWSPTRRVIEQDESALRKLIRFNLPSIRIDQIPLDAFVKICFGEIRLAPTLGGGRTRRQ